MPGPGILRTVSAAALLVLSLASSPACRRETSLERILANDTLTIAVTDSGLGGLSVLAEAAARLRAANTHQRVDLVFFNALFTEDGGYNSLPGREAKIRVFDAALRSLAARVRPDLILVACNTLSVLIPDLPFVAETEIPVLGIVDAGVALASEALAGDPKSSVILFGTETTIAEGEHRRRLLEAGFDGPRIVSQACPELANYIENDPEGEDTGLLIASYVDEAAASLSDPGSPVHAVLVCTHYGYALNAWKAAFDERGLRLAGILNPNADLAALLVPPGKTSIPARTEISIKMISMVPIAEGKRATLGAWLEKVSPETAAALRGYELVPGLFEWKGRIEP